MTWNIIWIVILIIIILHPELIVLLFAYIAIGLWSFFKWLGNLIRNIITHK